jgi:hypothetical protein
MAVEILQALDDVLCGALPLDPHRAHEDVEVGKSASQDLEHVAYDRARGRGHDADASGKDRQRALSGRVEETLLLEPSLELLEGLLQGAEPAGLHEIHVELVLAPHLVQPDAPQAKEAHAVLGLKPQLPGLGTKHDRPDLAPLVLEGQVHVAR